MAVFNEDISIMVRLLQKYTGPSVPRLEAEAAIYATLNEIEQHKIIKDDETYTTNIVQGADTIEIASPSAEYGYSGITYLAYRDRPMTPKTEQWLDDNDTNWRHSEEGEPLFYFMTTRKLGEAVVVKTSRKPAESVTDGYTYQAALLSQPENLTGTGNKILTWYRDWGEAVEFGAAGRMLMQPKRKWSNAALGKYYLNKWNQHKNEIIADARRSNVNASVGVKMIKWV